jgi:hypothetical protein
MAIQIPRPAIVLNSDDWNIANFTMSVSIEVPEDTNPAKAFDDAAKECAKLKSWTNGSYLTLIINCHGYEDKIPGTTKTGLGFGLALGTGITRSNVSIFSKFAPTVDEIIIVACGAAAISVPNGQGDGNLLCCAIAQHARAIVKASQNTQIGRPWRMDPFFIDDWEGTVLTYASDGSVINVEYH